MDEGQDFEAGEAHTSSLKVSYSNNHTYMYSTVYLIVKKYFLRNREKFRKLKSRKLNAYVLLIHVNVVQGSFLRNLSTKIFLTKISWHKNFQIYMYGILKLYSCILSMWQCTCVRVCVVVCVYNLHEHVLQHNVENEGNSLCSTTSPSPDF